MRVASVDALKLAKAGLVVTPRRLRVVKPTLVPMGADLEKRSFHIRNTGVGINRRREGYRGRRGQRLGRYLSHATIITYVQPPLGNLVSLRRLIGWWLNPDLGREGTVRSEPGTREVE